MDSSLFYLPSAVQEIILPETKHAGVKLLVKRDDLIHPLVSGNKWRKLYLNIDAALNAKKDRVVTFGGAFSNHIVATAVACQQAGIPSLGIIRGEEVDLSNPSLTLAKEYGMELIPVSRNEYALKNLPEYKEELYQRFGSVFIVPEGGANHYGVNGCMDIVKELDFTPDFITVAVGTGTTLAGIALAAKDATTVIGFPALKGGDFLLEEISALVYSCIFDEAYTADVLHKIRLETRFHFGGYGKTDERLVNFVNQFYRQTQLPLDLIYTGKLFYGLLEQLREGFYPKGSSILVIHTGGIQGNEGMKRRGIEILF